MRRVLIDYARSRVALKRGGAVHKVTFDELAVASDDRQLDVFALDEALKALGGGTNPDPGRRVALFREASA